MFFHYFDMNSVGNASIATLFNPNNRIWLHFSSPKIFFSQNLFYSKFTRIWIKRKKNGNKQNKLTVQSKFVLSFILGKINFGRIEEYPYNSTLM